MIQEKNNKNNIIFFGDSISYGELASPYKNWVTKISLTIDETFNNQFLVINSSVNGNTTRMALERMPNDVQKYGVFLLIIQFGMNDCNYWQTDQGIPRVSPDAFHFNLKEIIVNSSNIGMAQIANKIGKKNQQKFFKKLGFYKKISLEIDETAMPSANPNNWGKLETMTIGYGHGFAITPLHLSQAYASIVNDGYKVKPTLLLNNENSLFLEKIINTSTSKLIRYFLRAAVLETDYTGPRIKIKGYEIGGKTGTAELIDRSGGYIKDANRTTFVGVFPMSRPKYVVLAIVDDPKKIADENYSNTAATVVVPLVKNIILNMIKILSISPNLQNDFLKASNEKFALENKNVTF